ncbi:hypothetical protein ACA910_020530 [Epithemia clementina (nom. ined.)]
MIVICVALFLLFDKTFWSSHFDEDVASVSSLLNLRHGRARIVVGEAGTTIDVEVDETVLRDPCSVQYWMAQLSSPVNNNQNDTNVAASTTYMNDELLHDLTGEDIGVIHISFSIGGSKDRKANDRLNGTHNRDLEKDYSVACLKTTMPSIHYESIDLGDFASYQQALSGQHAWLADHPPYAGTFVIDTDVYANPNSAVTPYLLARALKNVDFAFVYSPERQPPDAHANNRVSLQLSGLQAGLMGQRSNKRTRLFHGCVSDILRKHSKDSIRQQYAINQVLESPLAQFLRIRWLPPEYHCWSPSLTTLENFTISQGPYVQDDPCYFVHSHNLAKKGGLEGKCLSLSALSS